MKLYSSTGLAGIVGVLGSLVQPSFATRSGGVHDGSWSPDYALIATAQNITVNCASRYSVVFNGTSSGPPLRLKEGKTTWVRVYNQIADQNVTVHWHGLSQRTAPFSDGTPLVAQWPIAPGEFFDYEIRPEFGDAGTYFYHSHVGLQAITAHGLLTVESANHTEPYDYDGDIPFLFGDYFRNEDDKLLTGLLANPFVWSGESSALVLNDRTGNASFSSATDDSCKPYIFSVKPGKTYRLRFVSATALSFIMLAIEGHANLTIIEADGQYTKPAHTDRIQLGSGQRFSALLQTKTEEELAAENKSSYWIRFENRDRPSNISGYALLQYDTTGCDDSVPKSSLPDLPDVSPVTLTRNASEYTSWLEYALESLYEIDAFPTLAEVTRTIYIQLNQKVIDGAYINKTIKGSLQWDSNNLTWAETTVASDNITPYLVAAYQSGAVPDYDAALANGGWDPATRAWPALVGEVLDIVWLSNSGPTGGFDTHPMHAHGAHYWDLGSGNDTAYDAVANEARFTGSGGLTPARRDTTQLYRYVTSGSANQTLGWRAWRLRVTEDNVGAWMMHCHILPHMAMGMSTVFVFGNASDIVADIPEPYVSGYLEYGGSAYGNESFDPLVIEYH
ncbi:L-ascorbate oxidase [Xylariales sp. PMI_506]|nr:L-ascorbate oxidase [Xylariales sp. PMI_506]